MTVHDTLGLVDVFAGVIPTMPFKAGVHLNYEETVLPMKDGLPKLRDFPAEYLPSPDFEVLVTEEAGKLPDKSITEVLQRVAGVTIDRNRSRGDPEHFSVEGSGIQVRGLSWGSSTLNGRAWSTASGTSSYSASRASRE